MSEINKLNNASDQIIVALDFPSWQEAEQIVEHLNSICWFKIGLELYLASRGRAVDELKARGKKVFLDLKFHDIPNTVSQACKQASAFGVDMMNIHISGGRTMIEQALKATNEAAAAAGKTAPLLIGVTVLTSLADSDLAETGVQASTEAQVIRLAKLARDAGLGGVVASPQEIALIREACGNEFVIVCPGVRTDETLSGDDQKRVMTPQKALQAGADFLVIGRPITRAIDPEQAAKDIILSIKGGKYA